MYLTDVRHINKWGGKITNEMHLTDTWYIDKTVNEAEKLPMKCISPMSDTVTRR